MFPSALLHQFTHYHVALKLKRDSAPRLTLPICGTDIPAFCLHVKGLIFPDMKMQFSLFSLRTLNPGLFPPLRKLSQPWRPNERQSVCVTLCVTRSQISHPHPHTITGPAGAHSPGWNVISALSGCLTSIIRSAHWSTLSSTQWRIEKILFYCITGFLCWRPCFRKC